jgi:hypothetical protein
MMSKNGTEPGLFSHLKSLIHTRPAQTASAEEWTDTDLMRMAVQARQAFERKQLKSCLVLTKILLQVDPDNAEAHALQLSIRSAIQQDLESARALLSDPGLKDNPNVFGRGAAIILRRILNVYPGHEEAIALSTAIEARLSEIASVSVITTSRSPQEPAREPTILLQPTEDNRPSVASTSSSCAEANPVPAALPETAEVVLPQAAATTPPVKQTRPKSPLLPAFSEALKFFRIEIKKLRQDRRALSFGFAALLMFIGFLLFTRQSNAPQVPNVVSASSSAAEVPGAGSPKVDVNEDTVQSFFNPQHPAAVPPDVLPPISSRPLSQNAAKAPTTDSPLAPVDKPLATEAPHVAPPPVVKRAASVASGGTGILAVNSRAVAEIYMGDKYLGSTPATLELPAGRHTLEYRYQDLRQTATYTVSTGETTRATVTFRVTVPINARPWAQVFLEGTERQPLGQTPLGEVSVPVGGVLVFENPSFTKKSYRITGTETAIQVVFP